ncbi:6707_t:CDS:1, partial [Gigaspora margarita]
LNNIVVSLYHEYDIANRDFINDVNQIIDNQPIVFEYKDLPDNEQLNSNASAIKRRDMLAGDGFCNLDQSLKCSLGYLE